MPPATFELIHEGFMPLAQMRRWTLVGGTALAIRYRHRLSEDLDFFVRNSTLEQDRKRIDTIITRLEEKGFEVARLNVTDTQIDFEISDVKVTFFASGLNHLQKNSISFGHVQVASLETIEAMKMDAILNHRTLTRDFFDIAVIMRQEKHTIFDLLDTYKKHYTRKLSPALILKRLTRTEFEPVDPGLTPMRPKNRIDPSHFREKLAAQIKQQARNDTQNLYALTTDPSLLERLLGRKFGLSRMNLPQKLATLGEDALVLKALKAGSFDIAYKDISGTTLLDYYLENKQMFSDILGFATVIPDAWRQSRTFKRYGLDHLIALENSVISCAGNKHNSPEKIARISSRHGITAKELVKRCEAKINLFQRRPTPT